MTNLEMGLIVMSVVVGGVSLFGAFWLKIERRQAEEAKQRAKAARYPEGQETFTFMVAKHDFEEIVARGR
jgi:Flp pilus assembly protein CpaB